MTSDLHGECNIAIKQHKVQQSPRSLRQNYGPEAPTLLKANGLWALLKVNLGRIYVICHFWFKSAEHSYHYTSLTQLKFGLNISGCSFGIIHSQSRKGNQNTWDFLACACWSVQCVFNCASVYLFLSISLYKSDWFVFLQWSHEHALCNCLFWNYLIQWM